MKLDGRVVAFAFAMTLAVAAVAWALSEQEIWNKIWIPASNSIRVLGV